MILNYIHLYLSCFICKVHSNWTISGFIDLWRDKDVYVLHSKGQTDGIILDWKRMCRSHTFCEPHKSPGGLITCEPSRNPKSLRMVLNLTPLNKFTFNIETPGKVNKTNIYTESLNTLLLLWLGHFTFFQLFGFFQHFTCSS